MNTLARHALLVFAAAGFIAVPSGLGQPVPRGTVAGASIGKLSSAEPVPSKVTTVDLARAYLELDLWATSLPMEPEVCREVNTAFDDASKLFFAGDLARVVAIVNEKATKLREQMFPPGWKPTHVTTHPVQEGRAEAIASHRAQQLAECDAGLDALTWPDSVQSVWLGRRELATTTGIHNSVESLVISHDLLLDQLVDEFESIKDGRNPYTNRRGDIWRPYFISDHPAPMRLFCPEHREPPAAGWPLVIALHGAGGNEHMFMAAYGAGRIKELAEQRGFIVASPLNSPLSAQPMVFDGLVDSIAADYPIDRTRVYLIGHSMGAGVALAWSKLRTDKVAASALIAGVGRFNAKDKIPPTLLIAPELDGLIPAKSIIAAADQAKGFGLPVECREIKDYGHTLVVGHVLPEVVEWLLEQRSSPAATTDSKKPDPSNPGDRP